MTTHVITVEPDSDITETAKRLIKNRISAVRVLEPDGRIVGIVSEAKSPAEAGRRAVEVAKRAVSAHWTPRHYCTTHSRASFCASPPRSNPADAVASGVSDPKVESRRGITLTCSEAKPPYSFGVVLRHAATVVVHLADGRLGASIILVGQWTQEPQGSCVIAFPIGRIAGIDIRHRSAQPKYYP